MTIANNDKARLKDLKHMPPHKLPNYSKKYVKQASGIIAGKRLYVADTSKAIRNETSTLI